MRPIDFQGSNAVYTKPKEMSDEECLPVSAFEVKDKEGRVIQVNTVWQPNKEDIEAINAGRPIILSVAGGGMPPVVLFTCDEEGNINE
ncbi:hypothetical protein [Albibacterium profundi]|uniref:Uncharacterized protein n=1 Tax=Albibacterium profundi TaxID=3134906 RepID=A0ABV5CF58_9SPHI